MKPNPLWREEFSVFEADERYVNRRQLTKFLTLTSLAMFAGNIWILLKAWLRAGIPYPMRAVARAGEIAVGGVKLFEYPGPEEQCILVRTSEESYVAYSQKCTNLSCQSTIRRRTGAWILKARTSAAHPASLLPGGTVLS